MKNLQVLELNEKIKAYSKNIKELQGAKFSYGIIKNTNRLQKECEDIVKVSEPSDEYKAYDKERIALCEKHAKKDENGEIIKKNLAENGSYQFDIDTLSQSWISEFETLREKNESVLSVFEKQSEEYTKFLEEESTIEFHLISINDVPLNVSVEMMSVLEPFISE